MHSVASHVVRLRGKPRSVRGFIPIALEAAQQPQEVVFDGLPPETEAPIVHAVPRGRHTELRLTLPASTPPGEYRGNVLLGAQRFAFRAQVESRGHLSCIPHNLELTHTPQKRVRETVAVINDGNIEVAIEKHYAFGLFEVGGLNRAIGKAFGRKTSETDSPLDAIAVAAKDEYGGLVTANVTEGAGPLPPGEARDLLLSFRFSGHPRPGAEYFGYLSIANLTLGVRVHVAEHDTAEAAS
jgi:hypothetical protein